MDPIKKAAGRHDARGPASHGKTLTMAELTKAIAPLREGIAGVRQDTTELKAGQERLATKVDNHESRLKALEQPAAAARANANASASAEATASATAASAEEAQDTTNELFSPAMLVIMLVGMVIGALVVGWLYAHRSMGIAVGAGAVAGGLVGLAVWSQYLLTKDG